MKSTILGMMLSTGMVWAQAVINPAIMGGAGAPSSACASGELYFNSSATAGQNLYVCVSNVWAQISGALPGTAMTNTSNTYAANTVQSFSGTLDASGAAATLPAQTGAALPGTCGTGQMFLKTGGDPSRMLYVCSAANTWSQAAFLQGTAAQKASACSVGQIYFATDAAAGSNLYFCTATNTWTQMGGSCANCVSGPASSTTGNVPQFGDTTGKALGAGLAVSTATTNNALAQRDSSGNLTATAFKTATASLNQYYVSAQQVLLGSETVTCSSSVVTLTASMPLHHVNLNNQATCTITFGGAGSSGTTGVTVLLCNGSTTATTSLAWAGSGVSVKGGMAAGGSAGQCAAQNWYYDPVNLSWYASSAGSTWN